MGKDSARRRLMRTGCAVGTAIFLLSPPAEAQVSGAACNLSEGSGTFQTAVRVWVDGVRTEVRIGERGLTREILFSPTLLLDWMRREFAGGDANIRVGFNDCMGSQTAPQDQPPQMDREDPPPPVLISPPTGNDTSGGGEPPPDWKPPPFGLPPTCNDCPVSPVGGLSDDTIVGDSWDELFA